MLLWGQKHASRRVNSCSAVLPWGMNWDNAESVLWEKVAWISARRGLFLYAVRRELTDWYIWYYVYTYLFIRARAHVPYYIYICVRAYSVGALSVNKWLGWRSIWWNTWWKCWSSRMDYRLFAARMVVLYATMTWTMQYKNVKKYDKKDQFWHFQADIVLKIQSNCYFFENKFGFLIFFSYIWAN